MFVFVMFFCLSLAAKLKITGWEMADPLALLCVVFFCIFVTFPYGVQNQVLYLIVSYDVASGSEITPCNKIDKPLVVYRFLGNVMTSVTTFRT